MSTSKEDLREASDEVMQIADGHEREAIDQRSRQAFDWANECRVRYQGIQDMSKRSLAVKRAYVWAEVLDYMDETGEPVFSMEKCAAFLLGDHRWWDAITGPFWFLRIPTGVRVWRDIFGTQPIVFYEWAGAASGARELPVAEPPAS